MTTRSEPAFFRPALDAGYHIAVGRYRDVPVKRVVCPGRPVQALRRAASGAYLLVLGRGGSRIAPLPRFGSVTHAFALDAACVVAIVPGRPAVG